MATGTTDFSKIPPSTVRYAEIIRDDFPDLWRGGGYVSPYTLPDISRIVQMRPDLTETVRKQTVSRYVTDLKAGDDFPAIVVSRDGFVFDGGHRLMALKRLHRGEFHAIVLGVNMEGAELARQDQLKLLAGRLNKGHGDNYGKKALEKLVADLHGDYPPSQIAKMIGMSTGTVKDIQNAEKARKRARELGLDVADVSRTNLKSLGVAEDKLTVPVFTEMAKLVSTKPVTAGEVGALIKRVDGLGTEAQRVKAVRAEIESRAGQIRAGMRPGVKPPQQARMHLAFFLEFEGREGLLTETTDPMMPEYSEQIWRVIGVLHKAAAKQDVMITEAGQAEITER